MVANHLGYVDVILLASQVEGVFVARGDLARWPLMGWLSRSVNTLFLDRANRRDLPRVGAEVAETLKRGVGVFLFPEGTSTATVESKTNFLRGITKGDAVAVSRVLHAGRTFIVVDTEVRDGDGRLAARVTQTQAVLRA